MKFLLTTLAILFFAGPLYRPENGIAKPGQQNQFNSTATGLRTGDIIVRKGKGFISELFRKSSRNDRQFSHAGIVQVTGEEVYVIHVLGTTTAHAQNLIREPISKFCNSHENTGYAVYRYSFLSGRESAVNRYLNLLALQDIEFDEQFDLATDSSLYCTELVYKMCLNTADHRLPVTSLDGRVYVGLDDLYCHRYATLITKQTY